MASSNVSSMTDEELDEQVLQTFSSLEEYHSRRLCAQDALKKAFLSLFVARRQLGFSYLTSAEFRHEFDAVLRVDVDSSSTNSFQLVKTENCSNDQTAVESTAEKNSKSNSLRNRKNKKNNESTASEQHTGSQTGAHEPNSESETVKQSDQQKIMNWFCALPSRELRFAQKQFHKALAELLEVANAARETNQRVSKLNAHLPTVQ